MKQKTLSEERRPLLKKKLEETKFIRAIEAHNGISGLIGELAKVNAGGKVKEFDALWISSLTDSVAKGYPDEEIVSIDSRLTTVNQVLNVTKKPLMFDGDTGGFLEQLNYLIRQLERVGVSAVVLEDKKYPKSNSLLQTAGHSMETVEGFCEKIKCAKSSQRSEEFMVIARIESFIAKESLSKALERAEGYLEAGADGIMIHSKSREAKEVLQFAEKYQKLKFSLGKKPLMCVPTTYHEIKEKDLISAGFNIILYANHLFRSAFKAMEQVCVDILKNERAFEVEAQCASLKDILTPVDSIRTYLSEYKQENHDQLSKSV